MDKECFGGVADPRPLAFAVENDVASGVFVGGLVNEDVADAVEVFDNRHRSFLGDSFDQRSSTAWDGDINQLTKFEEFSDELAICGLDELDGIGRESAMCEWGGDDGSEDAVGVEGFFSAAEDDSVAALDAQGSSINGDVGA